MRLTVLTLLSIVAASPVLAENSLLSELESNLEANGGFYLSSQSARRHNFDVWQLNSGYAYAVSPSLELYLSTSITSGNEQHAPVRGLASGVKYDLSPRLHIESAVTSTATESTKSETASSVGFEVSSRFHLTDNVNVHATYDYEDVEQQYVFGIGYRF